MNGGQKCQVYPSSGQSPQEKLPGSLHRIWTIARLAMRAAAVTPIHMPGATIDLMERLVLAVEPFMFLKSYALPAAALYGSALSDGIMVCEGPFEGMARRPPTRDVLSWLRLVDTAPVDSGRVIHDLIYPVVSGDVPTEGATRDDAGARIVIDLNEVSLGDQVLAHGF